MGYAFNPTGKGAVMTRYVLACAFVLYGCTANAENPIVVGTWNLLSTTQEDVETKAVIDNRGAVRGSIQYSLGGHVVVFLSEANQTQPAGPVYTDAERVAAHKSIVAAYSGTYKVEGNKVTHHIEAAWLPHWVGTDVTRYIAIAGNKLTIKTSPQVFTQTGRLTITTLNFEKVE